MGCLLFWVLLLYAISIDDPTLLIIIILFALFGGFADE
jgi:hypothetical protein